MILPQTGTLAPCSEPGTLLRQAVADLKDTLATGKVRGNMDRWIHVAKDNMCECCLAGASMLCRLECDTAVGQHAGTSEFQQDGVNRCLLAIDSFRRGKIFAGLTTLRFDYDDILARLNLIAVLPERVREHIWDRDNPQPFYDEMLSIADQLDLMYPPADQPIPVSIAITPVVAA